jgi:hypothetical protein
MSLHDKYARMTPFEIAFPDAAELDALVAEVIEETSSRRVDASLLGIFLTLGSVDDFLRRLQPPDAPEAAKMEYGALLFQAVHFVRAGRPLYLVETALARGLVEDAPAGDPSPPSAAGYLQLPQHLFWMGGSEERVPESLDGLFWVASASGALHVLPITGVLPDRAGFRALPLPAAPFTEAREWLTADMRGDTADYASAIPGHDLDRLYSVETAGEVLKLLARFFAHVGATHAGREEATPRARADEPDPERGPRPSALPYARIGRVA